MNRPKLQQGRLNLILRCSVLLAIIASLYGVTEAQAYVIDERTPRLTNCTYFDEYNNFISENIHYGVCSEPEFERISENEIRFTFIYDNKMSETFHDDTRMGNHFNITEGKLLEQIEIAYTEDNLIESYVRKSVYNYVYREYDRVINDDDSYEYILENEEKRSDYYQFELLNSFDDTEVRQRRIAYYLEGLNNQFDNIADFAVYKFKDDEYLLTDRLLKIKYIKHDDYDYEYPVYILEIYSDDYLDYEEIALNYTGYIIDSYGENYSIHIQNTFENAENIRFFREYDVYKDSYYDSVSFTEKNLGQSFTNVFNMKSQYNLLLLKEKFDQNGESTDYNDNILTTSDFENYSVIDYTFFDKLLYNTEYGYRLEYYSDKTNYTNHKEWIDEYTTYNDVSLRNLYDGQPYSNYYFHIEYFLNNHNTRFSYKLDSVFEFIVNDLSK